MITKITKYFPTSEILINIFKDETVSFPLMIWEKPLNLSPNSSLSTEFTFPHCLSQDLCELYYTLVHPNPPMNAEGQGVATVIQMELGVAKQ